VVPVFDPLPFGPDLDRTATHLVGGIGDQSADDSRFMTLALFLSTESFHKRVELFFAQIGMRCAQPANLPENLFGPELLASFTGGVGVVIERLWTLTAFAILASPVIQRPPLDLNKASIVVSSPYCYQNCSTRYRSCALSLTMTTNRRPQSDNLPIPLIPYPYLCICTSPHPPNLCNMFLALCRCSRCDRQALQDNCIRDRQYAVVAPGEMQQFKYPRINGSPSRPPAR